jgi:hypothetical protein
MNENGSDSECSSVCEDFQDAIDDEIVPSKLTGEIDDEQLSSSLESLDLSAETNWDSPELAEQQLDEELGKIMEAVQLFLNSRFKQAEAMLRSKFNRSLFCKFVSGYLVNL